MRSSSCEDAEFALAFLQAHPSRGFSAIEAKHLPGCDRCRWLGKPAPDAAGMWEGVNDRRRDIKFQIFRGERGRVMNGGRCRIRTCDFHRVKVALYR